MRLLLAFLLLLTPAPHARWDGAASVVSWSQTARGCLWQLPNTFVGCWDGEGSFRVVFGSEGPLDGALRADGATVYRVVVDGVTFDVPLRSVIYLPVIRSP